MTKTDLIGLVASECNTTKKETEAIINKTLEVIAGGLKRNEKVNISGFGIFEIKERAERKGVNPRTREEITIPASKFPSFKPSKTLKDLMV